MTAISDFVASKRRTEVLDLTMAYYEVGQGDPIVFVHGNPTSSIVWRDVIPHVAHLGRCIAPDLIGMGDSDKRRGGGDQYRFVEHRRYLDALLEQLDASQRVTLVLHDWGSALGFDWANRHRAATSAIAYAEGIVRPFRGWDEWPDGARRVFQGFRGDDGESMILDRNIFVERVLPGSIIRALTDEEMAAYRQPFAEPGDGRWPTLQWPREIPIGGEPADVAKIVGAYADWLSHSQLPKLFFNAEPGSMLIGAQREFCRSWPNQTEITISGIHVVQEDSADDIGTALARWIPLARGDSACRPAAGIAP